MTEPKEEPIGPSAPIWRRSEGWRCQYEDRTKGR
jgi:hypothetical protein